MPRSGCSALHGVNPNLKKKQNRAIAENFDIGFFVILIDIAKNLFLEERLGTSQYLLIF